MKLRHVLRQEIDALTISQASISDQVKLYKFFEELTTDLHSDNTYQQFGRCFTLEDTYVEFERYLLEQICSIMCSTTEEALCQFDEPLRKELALTKEKILQKLHAFTMPPEELILQKIPRENGNPMQNDTKVEFEKEVEMQVEAQIQQTNHQHNDYYLWKRYEKPLDQLFFAIDRKDSPSGLNEPCITNVNSILAQNNRLSRYSELFDKDLCTTKLFYESVKDQNEPLFGKNSQKRTYQLVFIVEDDHSMKGIIMDPAEVAMIRKSLFNDAIKERKILVVDLTTGFTVAKGEALTANEMEKFSQLQVQAKFFNGDLAYTKSERQILNKWLKRTNSTLAKELFGKIISCHVGLAQKYEKSSMKKYLESS
jgi:hypothetical protein